MAKKEKTQAQVWFMQSLYDRGDESIGKASNYFRRAIAHNPDDANAINGMANIYYYAHDYDKAIEFGFLAVEKSPTNGAVLNDLALSLEGKMAVAGVTPQRVEALKLVYGILEKVMPSQPQMFPASYLKYVQTRLQELNKLAETAPTTVNP